MAYRAAMVSHVNGMLLQAGAAMGAAARLVAALQRRLQAQLLETHISWILLTPEHAWKIKKPVRLGFLDFGSLAARRRHCEEERRLNDRLAPGLVLGVVPITGHVDDPVPGGSGTVLEVALQMRRFPDGALLSERLAAGTLAPAQVDRLAWRLARFHEAAPVADAATPYGTPQRIGADLRQVIERLAAARASHGLPFDAAPWLAWAACRTAELHGIWTARRRTGHVREGHGDLHLANLVFLDGEPTAFDAIEFDPALRWIDTLSDIAFPVMDLHARGRPDLAFRLLDAYLGETGDHAGLPVLRVYAAYRALVRALVQALHPGEPGPDYLQAAAGWRDADSAADARLLLTHGLPASGKSVLALELVQRCGAVRLRSDLERKRLHGLAPLAHSGSAPGAGLYDEAATQRTYARLLALSREALQAGWRVVVDAAFGQAAQRAAFARLAAELQVPLAIAACEAAEPLLLQRLAERTRRGGDPSEATAAVLALARRRLEPLLPGEAACVLRDAAASGSAAVAQAWLAQARVRNIPNRARPIPAQQGRPA